MKLPVRTILIFLGLTAGRLPGQVAGPSPLVSAQATAQTVPGGWIMAEERASAALQSGFPATAATIDQEMLRDPALPAETRQRVTLAMVTALLDAGELAAAETALRSYDGPRTASYQLRAGLLAVAARRIPQAKAALAAGKAEELPAADRGWWYFLQGSVADADGETVPANNFYDQAVKAAVSDLQRTRFVLGQEQSRLRSGQANEGQLGTLRGNMERFQGTRIAYTAVRTYAAALAGLGRAGEAQAVLQRQLSILPATERDAADQLGLMLGLIAGEGSVAGRQAFLKLLRDGQRPETQRLALQLLARGAKKPAEREQLRRDLGDLISAPGQNPIIEDLFLARAQTALLDKAYAPAEEDARALLERYPGSALKAPALGVRLAVAWDLKRYRTAAEVISQLRGAIPEGRDRAELGVLLAEAFFRSEDYKNAADAYDAALHELPAVVPAGILIFQRVLADMRAGQLESAAGELDAAGANPAFDPVNRMQAEWNLMKEMQVRGQTQAAYARVDRLLQGGAPGVPEELRIRLMWLRAKLSFDNGQADTAVRQTDELLAVLASATLNAPLRAEVASTGQLLKAQALLALGRDDEGGALLDKLRADYSASQAAEYSYIVQAARFSAKGETVKAQQLLIKLADEHKDSEFAPLALYEAALNAERRGLDDSLREAYTKLLERLIQNYPNDELVFYARLKQGDLLRKLNDFAAARQVYEFLVNNYAGHPDELVAQLGLADSLFAQGANNVASYASALAIYERLHDLPTAPVDLRTEAGFKWGYALAKRAQTAKTPAEREQETAKATTVFWSVVDAFLLDATAAAKLGAKGRYWVSRSLLELGQIHEDAGRLDEAQRAYQLIVDNKLGGAAQAQAKLARFRPGGGGKP